VSGPRRMAHPPLPILPESCVVHRGAGRGVLLWRGPRGTIRSVNMSDNMRSPVPGPRSRHASTLLGVILCLAAARMLAPAPAAAERLFGTPRYGALDTYPDHVEYVEIADITGDHVPDIVWKGWHEDNYEDQYPGMGCFVGPPRDLEFSRGSSGGVPFQQSEALRMAVGDVNGDGRSDVLTIFRNYDSETDLWVSLGSATGLQRGATIRLSGRPTSSAFLAVGDFDGDGMSDVAVAYWDSGGVSIFRGHADGSLSPASGFAVGSHPRALTAGDLNNDGRVDIVVCDDMGRVYSFLGDGRGGFQLHGGGVPLGREDTRLGLADFNGDTHLDLIVSGGVLLGSGAGGFGPKMGHGIDGVFAAGDFNSDGRLDLAVVSSAGLIALEGRGDGTFDQTIVNTEHLGIPQGTGDVAVGDLDQDGKLDLAVTITGEILNFYGNGDGTFGPDIPSYPVDDQAWRLATGDINGDFRADVAVLNGGSSIVSLLLSAPGSTFLPKRNLDTGAVPMDLLLKDLDRDGNLDLAVAQPDARQVSIFGGHGDGTFGPPTVIPITGKPSALASGDLNEDGFLDLAVGTDIGVWVFFGGPSGVGAQARFATGPYAVGRGQIVLVDLTGDGHLDTVGAGGDIGFVAGRGDGTFENPERVYADHENDGTYAGPLLTITSGCSSRVLTTWWCCGCVSCGDRYSLTQVWCPLQRGPGDDGCVAGGGGVSLSGYGAASDQVGDFNGDGTDDLLTGLGFVLLGPGYGSVQRVSPYWSGAFAHGDVNGDGKLDLLLLRSSGSPPRRSIELFLNQSARPTVPQSPGILETVSGGGSIALRWAPVLHPGLAGYRVRYGVGPDEAHGETEASEGPSPIEVPNSHTSLTLHCLPDSTFWVKVTAVDGLGRESACPRPVSARPGPVGGDFLFMGGSLNAASHGRWVMGLVQLDTGMSAARIVPGTVMVNGVGPADQLGVTDRDHDGRSELMIRFPRSAVQGSGAHVHVEGRVTGCRDTLGFAVDDSIRVRKPGSQPQAGAEDGLEGDRSVIAFALHPVAPSPTSAGCTIAFDLPEPAAVRLSVFDLRGRLMSTVLDGDMPAGTHSVWWERQSLPDGVYFARIEAGRFRAVRTILLIR
jgi:hypothetical protein